MNRLLILDDNERFAEVLQRSISGFEGYESETVQYVTTSEVAIELVKEATELQSPFNVLLIDQNLEAEMDGIQVMKEMLSIHSDADTIIFTGYDTPEDGLRAYEAGASRYLPKPFEPEELEFVLKELMRSRKVRLAEARQRQQFRIATKIAEAVGASLNLEDTMDAVLGTLYGVFDKTRLCVLLYDERQRALRFAPGTMKYYEIKNQRYSYQDTFPLNAGSLACQAAQLTINHKSVELVNVGDVSQDTEYL
ncbi:MAG TPA: response regulator, partial [Anaerolineales bacterium]|nr:response regulator [Anaerolineales bacterium]